MLQKLLFLYRFFSKLLYELLPAAVASCKIRTVTVAIAIALDWQWQPLSTQRGKTATGRAKGRGSGKKEGCRRSLQKRA